MMKLVGIVFLCVCCYFTFTDSTQAQQLRPPDPQDQISIRLRGLDGRTYDLASMRGSVVVASFGATWCRPCADELRALEELKKEYRDKPVKFLWIDIERENELPDSRLREFARSLKISFPVLRDPTKFTYAQFSDRVRIPLIIFFNKDGNMIAPKQFGMSTAMDYKARMRLRLDQVLASRPRRHSGEG